MQERSAMRSNVSDVLLVLGHRARHAAEAAELRFMAVNDSHELFPYRQAALWMRAGGVSCLSGVIQVEANAPFALWLNRACRHFNESIKNAGRCGAADLPAELADEWAEWLPAHGLWLPFDVDDEDGGGLLLARELPWAEQEVQILAEWIDIWHHAWRNLAPSAGFAWLGVRRAKGKSSSKPGVRNWWQVPALRWAAGVLLVALFPVRLGILAPGELVPANPAVIRAPIEGIVDVFHVQPNQAVKKGQPLFDLDKVLIQSRLDVAQQALATAETEYRQTIQQALADARSKAQLAMLAGKIEEKRAEALFLGNQIARTRITAPQDGIVLSDDPSEWIGRPVNVGERIMRIAEPADVEIEAWVPLADAIPLPPAAKVSLYLKATPFSPIDATVRYQAYSAVERPDGTFAYRLRAVLDAPTTHRVGLKGTVRLSGERVTLIYWVLRRPIASVRSVIGW